MQIILPMKNYTYHEILDFRIMKRTEISIKVKNRLFINGINFSIMPFKCQHKGDFVFMVCSFEKSDNEMFVGFMVEFGGAPLCYYSIKENQYVSVISDDHGTFVSVKESDPR